MLVRHSGSIILLLTAICSFAQAQTDNTSFDFGRVGTSPREGYQLITDKDFALSRSPGWRKNASCKVVSKKLSDSEEDTVVVPCPSDLLFQSPRAGSFTASIRLSPAKSLKQSILIAATIIDGKNKKLLDQKVIKFKTGDISPRDVVLDLLLPTTTNASKLQFSFLAEPIESKGTIKYNKFNIHLLTLREKESVSTPTPLPTATASPGGTTVPPTLTPTNTSTPVPPPTATSTTTATPTLTNTAVPAATNSPTPLPTNTSTPPPGATTPPDIGVNANLHGYRLFPATNAWNTRIDNAPVEDSPPTYLYSGSALHPDFGGGGAYGIPFNVVGNSSCSTFSVPFEVADESDNVPYPICTWMGIEGRSPGSFPSSLDPYDGDHHLLVYNRDNHILYEIYNIQRNPNTGAFSGYSGAVWDVTSNMQRPLRWTSSDAAGLQVLPGLVRYDEVAAGEVKHAIRFTLQHTRNAFVDPARHAAGYSDPGLSPMGMRVRLKASTNTSSLGPQARVIADAMKKYGMILADNGSNWFFSGTADARWDDNDLNGLKSFHGSDFEVIEFGTPTPQ